MKCQRCSFEFSDTYKFCPECGTPTKKYKPTAKTPENYQELLKRKSKGRAGMSR